MIHPIIEHPIKGKKMIKSLSFVKLSDDEKEETEEIIEDDQEILNFFQYEKNLHITQKINSKIITNPEKGKKKIKSLSCVEINDEESDDKKEFIEINIDELINDKCYKILFVNEDVQKNEELEKEIQQLKKENEKNKEKNRELNEHLKTCCLLNIRNEEFKKILFDKISDLEKEKNKEQKNQKTLIDNLSTEIIKLDEKNNQLNNINQQLLEKNWELYWLKQQAEQQLLEKNRELDWLKQQAEQQLLEKNSLLMIESLINKVISTSSFSYEINKIIYSEIILKQKLEIKNLEEILKIRDKNIVKLKKNNLKQNQKWFQSKNSSQLQKRKYEELEIKNQQQGLEIENLKKDKIYWINYVNEIENWKENEEEMLELNEKEEDYFQFESELEVENNELKSQIQKYEKDNKKCKVIMKNLTKELNEEKDFSEYLEEKNKEQKNQIDKIQFYLNLINSTDLQNQPSTSAGIYHL